MSHLEDSITKIEICKSLLINGVSPEKIPAQLRATVYRWKRKLDRMGIRAFIRKYRAAKQGRRRPNKTHPLTKVRIFKIRDEYRNCCGEKIKHILEKECGEKLSVATIYKILGEKYQLRSKWKKYSKRGFVRKGAEPREVIQTDTVDFGELFAFTAIDTYTREAAVVIKSILDSHAGAEALERQIKQFGHIAHIQRDGGPEFKKDWQDYAQKHIPSIRTA